MQDLVSWSGVKPTIPAVEAQSLTTGLLGPSYDCVPWQHTESLKLALVGVFTPCESVEISKCYKLASFPPLTDRASC